MKKRVELPKTGWQNLTAEQAEGIVEDWNRRYPVGQAVVVRRITGEVVHTATGSRAQLSGQGTPFVLCVGVGWYILNRVDAVVKESK